MAFCCSTASLRAVVISACDRAGKPLGLAVRNVPHAPQNFWPLGFSCWHRGQGIWSGSPVRIVSGQRGTASRHPGRRQSSASRPFHRARCPDPTPTPPRAPDGRFWGVARPRACWETPSAAPTGRNSRLRHAPDGYTPSWRRRVGGLVGGVRSAPGAQAKLSEWVGAEELRRIIVGPRRWHRSGLSWPALELGRGVLREGDQPIEILAVEQELPQLPPTGQGQTDPRKHAGRLQVAYGPCGAPEVECRRSQVQKARLKGRHGHSHGHRARGRRGTLRRRRHSGRTRRNTGLTSRCPVAGRHLSWTSGLPSEAGGRSGQRERGRAHSRGPWTESPEVRTARGRPAGRRSRRLAAASGSPGVSSDGSASARRGSLATSSKCGPGPREVIPACRPESRRPGPGPGRVRRSWGSGRAASRQRLPPVGLPCACRRRRADASCRHGLGLIARPRPDRP